MTLHAHALATGQHELELAVGVAVGGRRGMVLARGGREAVQHRGDERPQARLAGLVRAVDDEHVLLGEALQLELGERPVGADADAVDPHGAASVSSASASVSSISPSSPARYARRAAGSPESSPASTAGASSSSSASSLAARLAISSAAPSRCGWPRWRSRSSGGRRCSQRSSALSAPSASASSSAAAAALLGVAQGERERRAAAQLQPHDQLLTRGARLRRLERDHRLAGERRRDPRRATSSRRRRSKRTRRERHELDLGPSGGVDLDDQCALGARLADIVRREAARVPGGRLRAHLLALVHVAERPVGVAAIEILGRAGRIALARARQPRRPAHAARRSRPGPAPAASAAARLAPSAALAWPIATTCPSRRAVGVRELDGDGLVRERERAAGLRERSERAARIVVAARDDDRDAGLAHARELRERVMQRRGPDLAALEEIAGDRRARARLALDGQLADARERLALGGAHPRPHARVEARAGGVEVAVRGVDDPQHGGRS